MNRNAAESHGRPPENGGADGMIKSKFLEYMLNPLGGSLLIQKHFENYRQEYNKNKKDWFPTGCTYSSDATRKRSFYYFISWRVRNFFSAVPFMGIGSN